MVQDLRPARFPRLRRVRGIFLFLLPGLDDVLVLLGVGSVGWGAYLFHPGAGFISWGLGLLVVGFGNG